ncbi:Uu.00g088140.m01.CDS01 [Anthostomella pinea]|uniref:Uu.00g088140.m01.CDS01 n=1 Tax=Anthostomella pinea TaxID=933095 RepID=A0AAI8VH21_9PEZI|nr:Uu.00g088140.m01.CDS01 [Anthostomella pinea]
MSEYSDSTFESFDSTSEDSDSDSASQYSDPDPTPGSESKHIYLFELRHLSCQPRPALWERSDCAQVKSANLSACFEYHNPQYESRDDRAPSIDEVVRHLAAEHYSYHHPGTPYNALWIVRSRIC